MNDPHNTNGNDSHDDNLNPEENHSDAETHQSGDEQSSRSAEATHHDNADKRKADHHESIPGESSSTPSSSPNPSATSAALLGEDGSASRRTGKAWSMFALLLALLALALASYPYWPWQIAGLSGSSQSAEALAELQQRMNQFDRESSATRRDLERQIEAQDDLIVGLQNELQQRAEATPPEQADFDLDARVESLVQAQLALQLESQAQQEALRSQQELERQSQLEERIDGELSGLGARIESLQNQQVMAEADRAEQLAVQEANHRQQLEQLTSRLEAVGQELNDTGQGVSEQLLLIQVEALLALGQDRLELEADAVGANAAFQRALMRLQSREVSEGVTALNALQQSIQREQALIQDYLNEPSEVSADQRFVRLNELAEQVPEWPDYTVGSISPDGQSDRAETEGWSARVGQALSGLVRIEHVEQAEPSASEVEQSRERVRELLRAAALAGAQGNWNLNQVLIEAAQAEMQTVLNIEDATVQSVLSELDQLKIAPVRSVLPSLGQSRGRISELLERSQ